MSLYTLLWTQTLQQSQITGGSLAGRIAQLIRAGSWYLFPLGHGDTGQRKVGNRCLGTIRSKKLPFSPHLATYLNPLVQTQPGSFLQVLIAHGHDFGCEVGDGPIPEWQEDPILGVWERLSGSGCLAAEEQPGLVAMSTCLLKREGSLQELIWGRSRPAGTLQAGLTSQTLFCLPLQGIFSMPGTWVLHCFSSTFSFQSQKNHPCWKKQFCPVFIWKSIYPCSTLVLSQGRSQCHTETMHFV